MYRTKTTAITSATKQATSTPNPSVVQVAGGKSARITVFDVEVVTDACMHDTYLTTVKLREKFTQLKRFLIIQKPKKPANHKQLEALEDVVSKLQKDLTQQKLITDTITKENLRMEKELKYLGSQEYMNKLVDTILKKLIDFNAKLGLVTKLGKKKEL